MVKRGVLIAMLAACGPSAKTHVRSGGRMTAAHLDPVKPAAMREFEAAMRAMRLGGPEAMDTAKSRLKGALQIDATIWEAWHDLGVIAYNDGADDEAVDDFTKALAINKGHMPSLLARAEANRRAGHKKEARADYESVLKNADEDDPSRRDAATRLAALLRDDGAYDDAVDMLRDTVRTAGVNARIFTELGQIYIAQKRYELAQLVLAKAVELDPKDPAVYNALALLALRQGKAQDAFDRFDHAADLDANYLDARFNKASVLLDAGDYARAKIELSAIVEKHADDYAALVALGVAERGLKDFPGAKSTWENVIKDAPRHSTVRADAMWNLVILKADFMSDPAGAKADLASYLQDAPAGHAKQQAAAEKQKELK
jgi:tetratricopeptide (TPR) repeat protein